MKKLLLGFFLLAVAGVETNGQTIPANVLSGTQLTTSRTLDAETCYILRDCYVVESGQTLTIPKGTVIRCESESNLIIEQGAELFAEGSAIKPIVFTSDQAIGSRKPGDWGSLIINGNAKNNVTNNGGGKKSINRCGNSYLGGDMDDGDNSGTITYLRLEYGGGGTLSDDEKSALILNSVGSGTTIEHVQITESAENGLSIFGGTVDFLNGYILDAYKNDVFIDLGYRGTISGLLTMRQNPAAHHTLGSNSMLVWNNETNKTYNPLTSVKVYNSSLIGPEHCNSGSLSSDFKDGISFDNNGGGEFYNNVITGFKEHALYFEDAQSAARTANDELNFSYNSMTNNGSGDYAYGSLPWSGCGSSMTAWITGSSPSICKEVDNQFNPFVLGYDASFCEDYCDENYVPNFVLTEDSELDLPGSSSIYANRGAVQTADSFYWVYVCPQNQVYCTPEMGKEAKERKSGLIIVPNPTQNQANLVFEAKTLGLAKVLILDKVTGRILFQKNITIQHIGEQKIPISVKGIKEGVYPIQVQMKDMVMNGKISIK